MWSSKPSAFIKLGFSVLCLTSLSACTVQPLHGSNTAGQQIAQGADNSVGLSIQDILARTEVTRVKTRVAQQVRNHLLFALNGGSIKPDGRYEVTIKATSSTTNLSIANDSLAPTSARVSLLTNYIIKNKKTGQTIAEGKRRSVAAFDRTRQSFANERAERDAQNRAAKDVAAQIKLAIAQSLANR